MFMMDAIGPSDVAAPALRRAGLRVTAARVAALEILGAGGHPTVDEVATSVRARIGAISLQAVYDMLRVMADRGVIRRIEPAGHPARYEGRTGDNHHHLVCRGCGAVTDVDCAVGAAPCLTPANDAGYLVDEAEVTYWGLCPACRAAAEPARPAPEPSR